jgi:hypothetical protein
MPRQGQWNLDTILNFRCERVVIVLIGGLGFEESEGDFGEFVEDGDEDGHFGFAGGGEAVGKSFEAWIGTTSDHGGHEEHPAEVTVALVADGSGGTGSARLADARSHREPGGRGASVGQMARQLGGEPAGGALADAWDLAEALDVCPQLRRSLEMGRDLGIEGGEFPLEPAHEARDALGDERISGGVEAIALGLEGALKFREAAHERAQCVLGGAGGNPRGKAARERKPGDERGIDAVGLVAAAEAAGVILDAARVGEMNAMARGVEFDRGQFRITAGRLEDAHGCRRAEVLQPSAQVGDAALGIIELGLEGARAEAQAGVEFGFRNVEAQAGGDGSAEDHEWMMRSVDVVLVDWPS